MRLRRSFEPRFGVVSEVSQVSRCLSERVADEHRSLPEACRRPGASLVQYRGAVSKTVAVLLGECQGTATVPSRFDGQF